MNLYRKLQISRPRIKVLTILFRNFVRSLETITKPNNKRKKRNNQRSRKPLMQKRMTSGIMKRWHF